VIYYRTEVVIMPGTIPIIAVKILFCIGVLFIGGWMILLGYPLTMRQVKMNPWVGIRFSQAFYSEENWYKINHYGGKAFMIWGACAVVAGILIAFLPIDDINLLLAAYFSVYATLIIPIILTAVYADRLKRESAKDMTTKSR
jgi:hypothetical protein